MPSPYLRGAPRTSVFAFLLIVPHGPAPATAQPSNAALAVEVRAASALRDSGEYLRADSTAGRAAITLERAWGPGNMRVAAAEGRRTEPARYAAGSAERLRDGAGRRAQQQRRVRPARALLLGGAESQVMMSWRVDDRAMRDIMVRYYERLRDGEGRVGSLRQVQREMLGEEAREHPYYWAAFVSASDWWPLPSSTPP